LNSPKLSLCIATYNRQAFIGETLQAIVGQLPNDVELVIVDGASSDNTAEVIAGFAQRYPQLRYYREAVNSGVDKDFDKAVCYARGEYCWLMSDDDLLAPGAVERVLSELRDASVDLLVVNAEIRNADLTSVLSPRRLEFGTDRVYGAADRERFFVEVADYLTFIGGVVIRRQLWLQRDRESYFGTLFIHVGVIFQLPPLHSMKVIADPLVVIRYGNAMWTARGFEIWTFKWPALIWSFAGLPDAAKQRVVKRKPWALLRRLLVYRAIGAYSYREYRGLVAKQGRGIKIFLPFVVSLLPAAAANSAGALYYFLCNRKSRAGLYDFVRSRHATAITRAVARFLGVPTS
jgi:abequosyltransferase